jgi:hypothetical protein
MNFNSDSKTEIERVKPNKSPLISISSVAKTSSSNISLNLK